ncbi:origin recognition complex subunit 4 C-terminus-domain-containing protein [Yarrowia lipolytica]|uniref:Origin recognition complex subunit 4 n=1 Tax=Yarrowia lipolytica (strain CLIB 122 / E 150) TaxID=284591 RepID=Q6C5R0_YARLI|nr:YALI0E15928p [Yarrowia lipolytica CLIB122]RDW29697.1 origin recognition complex subunit 4 C-terminus-domain-containing protein [Yarrowia lipolytica]RDW39865.1 origin recognition complex subunit 4 C-terminus-domain-containing protein [Yarrowia lipolytica]RDW46232.1 origin recognition complex subunit 4 C-terminus-domain-containing protein [Yarrowia lipolytica]RDW50407.1 origin recognition complex subunit 4 C-terminus-domain-containing protein [Yarrowia lipolytica]CAG79595.1 YALI0E15928p [Yarr|eukprot:XP_504002.1 YALI0E15928p [Yarrowia lipolytica CLIB122]
MESEFPEIGGEITPTGDKMDVEIVEEVVEPAAPVLPPPQVPKPEAVSETMIDTIKSRTLSILTGKSIPEPIFLDGEKARVYSLMENAIRFGEGNSCIIVGPRGTGKTLIVESALTELEEKYNSAGSQNNFITIRLSGYAQTDDKMAVREIARQLDTVLLNQGQLIENKSISETLNQILSLFDRADIDESEKETVSLVFILDEFDRFCSTTKQTLLYTLFDVAQSSRAPIAVIGLTPRINARELLEKRVRSRFSQRVVQVKRQHGMNDFWAILRNAVIYPENLLTMVKEEGGNKTALHTDVDLDTVRYWNWHWESMFQAGPLRDHVERLFHTTKSCREFFTSAILAVSQANPWINPNDFVTDVFERGVADTESFIEGLSDLELSLIICAAKVEVMFEVDQVNFNLAYEEYIKTAKEQREALRAVDLEGMATGTVAGFRIWSRGVARAAWEKLESLNLLSPVEKSAKRVAKQLASDTSLDDEIRMTRVDVSLQELTNMLGNSHHLIQWTKIRR